MSEEKFACPKCGTFVSKGDRFCKNCGASLIEVSVPEVSAPVVPEQKIEQPYERKFSLIKRFYRLLTAPSGAMEDIALAPDYGGVAIIIVIEVVLSILSLTLYFQRIHFTGTHAEEANGYITLIWTLGCFLSLGVIVVRWLIKSLIVKYACDSGSAWNFGAAASITGYAYLADIIVGVISYCVSWYLMPSITINTTDLQAAIQTMNSYKAQLSWLMLVYSLPLSFIGLIWKSYFGGLGAHFGTGEDCSLGKGVAVFFILGLIGLLISFSGIL